MEEAEVTIPEEERLSDLREADHRVPGLLGCWAAPGQCSDCDCAPSSFSLLSGLLKGTCVPGVSVLWYFTCCPLADSDALTQRNAGSFQNVVNRIMLCQHWGGCSCWQSLHVCCSFPGGLCHVSWTKLKRICGYVPLHLPLAALVFWDLSLTRTLNLFSSTPRTPMCFLERPEHQQGNAR